MTGDYLNVNSQDRLYQEAVAVYAASLERLVKAYEKDVDKRRDLLQDIHLALWLSFEKFEGRCSLRTWVYRVAHNTATSHVIRQRRKTSGVLLSIEDIETIASPNDYGHSSDQRMALERLFDLIHQLKPLEREVMLLYLEDLDAASIAEITGISAGHVRVLVHRIKAVLSRQFHRGGPE
jgi:RNA polymerase sigma-70 factor (ECF subfamily)